MLFVLASVATADEGMWTFDKFPSQTVGQKHGFAPDQAWLDRVRLASVRLAEGCSASFVSPNGLVLTNHHCAASCIQQASSAKNDYSANGFAAAAPDAEKRCSEQEANVLIGITEVTARMESATKGLSDRAARDARRAEQARIEKECATSENLRCDVVSLYGGGVYSLYKYRRYQDVRLVFAPETPIAFFGGDPDNFNFPRYDLDLTFLRVWENGKPLETGHYFPFAAGGSKLGDLTFVSGHPGRTDRQFTVSMLEHERDFAQFNRLLYLAEIRGVLLQFANRGDEQRRISEDDLMAFENSYKAIKGEEEALLDKAFFHDLRAREQDFRDKVESNAGLKRQYGAAWDEIAAAVAKARNLQPAYNYLERPNGFRSDLYRLARILVRMSEEYAKPNEKRLEEYADARKPERALELASPAPIDADYEIEKLSWSLGKMREVLGADNPAIRGLFGKRSPREIALEAVRGTALADPAARKKLMEGGKPAIGSSTDSMIQLARLADPFAREARKRYEDEVESVIVRNQEKLAKARFAVFGSSLYPDATFTLRLSYGTVKGWTENGRPVNPYTIFGGAFERATGRFPFALPQSWLDAKPKLDLQTPFNFVTDNDIVGGNSGSPMIDRDARLIGLIFDGNIRSLGGTYGFDDRVNRAVAVDVRAILEALDKVYGAKRVLEELRRQ